MTAPAFRMSFGLVDDQEDPCNERWNLFHHVLTGNLFVVGGAVDLGARFGWIPMLNVALQLDAIAEVLTEPTGSAAYEFTESEDRLWFVRSGSEVRVSATYADGTIVATTTAVESELRRFRRWCIEESLRLAPCVQRRKEFAEAFRRDLPGSGGDPGR